MQHKMFLSSSPIPDSTEPQRITIYQPICYPAQSSPIMLLSPLKVIHRFHVLPQSHRWSLPFHFDLSSNYNSTDSPISYDRHSKITHL